MEVNNIFRTHTEPKEYIEDITWPCGDTKFLFECWKIFQEWAQRTSEIFFQHEKQNFVSPRGHVMFYLLYKQQWLPNHLTLIVFWCERHDLLWSHSNGDIFTWEDNMLFSHVEISSFRVKLTWYFTGVYIVKTLICVLNSPNHWIAIFALSDWLP